MVVQANNLWLSPAQLATRWGISEVSARRHIHVGEDVPAGKLRGFRVGGARLLRVHIEDVIEHEGRKQREKTNQRLRMNRDRPKSLRLTRDRFADL